MTSAKQPAGADEVDLLAAAVRAVPGVAALHPGMFGEVGTYLPGRRVPGIRTVGDVTEVVRHEFGQCLTVFWFMFPQNCVFRWNFFELKVVKKH